MIEIAVSSLREDLSTALELYARAMIPVYWVLDVPGRPVLIHHEPRAVEGRGAYTRVEILHAGESLPIVLDGREASRVPVEEILR